MSKVIGIILILAALVGVVYFGVTLGQDIAKKVRNKNKAGKK